MSDQTPGAEHEPLSPSAPEEPTSEGTPLPGSAAGSPGPAVGEESSSTVTPAPPVAPAGYGPVPPYGGGPVPPSGPPAADPRRGFFVPRWAAIVLGAIVAALVFGGIGFAIGDSGGGGDRVGVEVRPPRGPAANGRRPGFAPFGGGNGNGNQRPAPTVPAGSGFLGVSIAAPSSGSGAQITGVSSSGPAANAGLKTGDVITKVDDTTISAPADLVRAIGSHKSGDTVTITYTRNGTSSTVKVTLANRAQAGSVPS